MKVAVVKKMQEKKTFEDSWNGRSPEKQRQIYQRLSRAYLQENYQKVAEDQGRKLQFMRDHQKKMQNGKGHPLVEQVMMC